MINKRLAQVCVTEALIREVSPIIFTALSSIEERKKVGCYLRFLLQGHKNSLKLDIHQEIERRKLPLPMKWEGEDVLTLLLEQIKQILHDGALNTLCRGIDDHICLRIAISPSDLTISTVYARTEFIQISQGAKQNKREKYVIEETERLDLITHVFELVESLLVVGFSRFRARQQGSLSICYFPDIFIYRDRLTSKERYELQDYLIEDSLLPPKELPKVNNIITIIRDFIQGQEIQNTVTRGDYELKINLSASDLDISSVYHDSQQY